MGSAARTANAIGFNIGPGSYWDLGPGWGNGVGQVDAAFSVDPALSSVSFNLSGLNSYISFQFGSITLNSTLIPTGLTPSDLAVTAYLNLTSPEALSAENPAAVLAIPGSIVNGTGGLAFSFDPTTFSFWGGKFAIDLYPDLYFNWAPDVRNAYARITLTEVPEPAVILLLGISLTGLAFVSPMRRKCKKESIV
jgi:hypothetical protein